MVSRSLSVVVGLGFLSSIMAQTTDASCLPFYQWTSNSHKKSPCEVASALLGVCAGSYNVAALPPDTHYLGPALAMVNPCQCNTVVYSLMSACGSCQGRTYDSWSTWSANCANVSIMSFPEPIPPNIVVPGWAYLDVKANDKFNELLAKQNANKTESSAIPSPKSTTTLTETTSTIAAATSTITPLTTETSITRGTDGSPTPPSDARANAIVGGVIGGMVGVALLIGLLYWYMLRRRRIAESGIPLPSPTIHSPVEGSESTGMRQYLANTLPMPPTPSINTSSLASPVSAVFTQSSVAGSVRSLRHSNV